MDVLKRRSLLALLALPTGCAIQYLPPLASSKLTSGAPFGAIRAPALGQSWTYQKLNFYNSQRLDTVKEEIVGMTGGVRISRRSQDNLDLGDELQPVWGQVTQDPYWDFLQTYEVSLPLWLDNFAIGTSQSSNTHYRSGSSSFRYWISARTTVVGWEKLVLPSGRFDTVRIEKIIRLNHPDLSRLDTLRRDTIWLAPEIGRWVARETNGEFRVADRRGGWTGREDHFRWQLESWT
ncbi:MAG: hypothetical protein RLZZ296_379 [Pseudomonadota bacterium]|jgi:hypothetical protein